MVPADLDALFSAFIRQLLHDILFEWGSIHHIILRKLGIEQAEAIMVLTGDDDILHARFLCHPDPLCGIELHRIELWSEFLILFHRNLSCCQYPFRMPGLPLPFAGGYGIEPPVDEHPKTGFTPPGHPLVPLFLRLSDYPTLLPFFLCRYTTGKETHD
ncbi:hypothetical protein ES703_57151 [subsurface metagenome]